MSYKKYTWYKDFELLSQEEENSWYVSFKDCWHNDYGDYEDLPGKNDEMFYKWCKDEIQYNWEDDLAELTHAMKGRKFKVLADLGLWYGRRTGFVEKEGIDALYACLGNGLEYVEIYEQRGTLKVNVYHHDGTNHFIIKEITNKGLRSPHLWKECYGVE